MWYKAKTCTSFQEAFDCAYASLITPGGPILPISIEAALQCIENLSKINAEKEVTSHVIQERHRQYATLLMFGILGIRNRTATMDAVRSIGNIVHALKTLMFSKQRDYGKGNITKFAHLGLCVRMSDKLERLKNLLSQKDGGMPKHESIEDTYCDISNYAIIGEMLNLEIFELPLED